MGTPLVQVAVTEVSDETVTVVADTPAYEAQLVNPLKLNPDPVKVIDRESDDLVTLVTAGIPVVVVA